VRVRLAVKAGVSILAMLLAALPVMACARPGAEMTAIERECCKKMAAQCGGSGMKKSHGCCQTTVSPDTFDAVKASSSQIDHSLADLCGQAVPLEATVALRLAFATNIASPPHSPPGLPPSGTTVLRI
jgi:hypothetical protein